MVGLRIEAMLFKKALFICNRKSGKSGFLLVYFCFIDGFLKKLYQKKDEPIIRSASFDPFCFQCFRW